MAAENAGRASERARAIERRTARLLPLFGMIAALTVIRAQSPMLPPGMTGHGQVVTDAGDPIGRFQLRDLPTSREPSFPFSIELTWSGTAVPLPGWDVERP